MKLLLLAVAVSLAIACGGPLGPIPGGALSGTPHTGPVDDWAFADAHETIQIEVRSPEPYSVNVWCGVVDGTLYVPTSLILGPDDPRERGWVRFVDDDPEVRLRIDDTLFDLRAIRVEGEERDRAHRHLLAKYEVEPDDHSGKAWVYRMEPR